MKNKWLRLIHWMPTMFYGIYMLILYAINDNWEETGRLSILLIILPIILIPLLLFSILNTMFYDKTNKGVFIKINIAIGVLYCLGSIYLLYRLYGLYDLWIFTAPIIIAFILYAVAIAFRIIKVKR
ncbi:MAG: hypothetical protein PHT03_07235 [Bacilli bacterium]|nr:hypothetical protein [Bacilli bacterium]MDD4388016.1 hypothetical protein [Bacilli bacterium]